MIVSLCIEHHRGKNNEREQYLRVPPDQQGEKKRRIGYPELHCSEKELAGMTRAPEGGYPIREATCLWGTSELRKSQPLLGQSVALIQLAGESWGCGSWRLSASFCFQHRFPPEDSSAWSATTAATEKHVLLSTQNIFDNLRLMLTYRRRLHSFPLGSWTRQNCQQSPFLETLYKDDTHVYIRGPSGKKSSHQGLWFSECTAGPFPDRPRIYTQYCYQGMLPLILFDTVFSPSFESRK